MIGMTRLFPAAGLFFGAAFGQIVSVRMENILPRDTDPTIDSALAAHRAALATGISLRQGLFLFLHGGGGNASGAGEITKTAAEQGFHAVAVTYPMNVLPSDVCSGPPGPCQEAFRREILEGADHSPLISISKANGVENRLIKLLRHLEALHPGENWSQFDSGGVPSWSRITVYGHSMGAANAALLAKLHALPRVCLSGPATDISSWYSNAATPPARIYGFSHAQDPMVNGQMQAWTALGLDPLGPLQDIASMASPYGNTHRLLTRLAPAPGPRVDYHNSPTMDAATPKDSAGVPLHKPVWIYMMAGSGGTSIRPRSRPKIMAQHALFSDFDLVGRKIPRFWPVSAW